jgi:hypothetical protein
MARVKTQISNVSKKQWGDLKLAVHAKQALIHDTIEAVV